MIVDVLLSNGYTRQIQVPEGVTLETVQLALVQGTTWPADANIPGWFYNPTQVVGIRHAVEFDEVTE